MTQPYWAHDTVLFEAHFPKIDDDLTEIRGKIHQSKETYTEEYARSSPLPLRPTKGKRIAIEVAPYIQSFVQSPERTSRSQTNAPVVLQKRTTVHRSTEQDIGRATGYYYPQEQMLVIWECHFFSPWMLPGEKIVGTPYMEALWQAFERVLTTCFPDATRTVTLGHDPDWGDDDFQAFLCHLGYEQSEGMLFEKMPFSPSINAITG